MSASLARLFWLIVIVVAMAIVVPRFAPGLVAAYLGGDSSALLSPTVATQPSPAVDTRPPRVLPPPPIDQIRSATLETTVSIDADERGHFLTDAVIDGSNIPVMVDTGATTVALSSETARRLGLSLAAADYTARVATANGVIAAAPVTLSEVRLGNISIRNVSAVVIPGNATGINLLGMSFLGRLTRFEVDKGRLLLVE